MLAILLYKYTPNIDDVPGDWPAETYFVSDRDVSTVLPPWIVMSELEFEAYINEPSLVAVKEIWNNSQGM